MTSPGTPPAEGSPGRPSGVRQPIVTRALVNLAAWAVGRRRRIRVAGESMHPTLVDGEFVLISPSRRPDIGEVVVSYHPQTPPDGDCSGLPSADLLVIKRVADRLNDGSVVLQSDNPAVGTDSRTWGPVDPDLILGTVTVVLDRLLSANLGAPRR